jgi:hypothetical protein
MNSCSPDTSLFFVTCSLFRSFDTKSEDDFGERKGRRYVEEEAQRGAYDRSVEEKGLLGAERRALRRK